MLEFRTPGTIDLRTASGARGPMPWIRSVALMSVGLHLLISDAPVAAQAGAIAGRVTDRLTDRAVAGALVEARGGRGFASTTTDREGAFRLAGLTPGRYSLAVAAAGYHTQDGDHVELAAAGAASVHIRLEPAPLELNPLTATISRTAERALDAPAHVAVIAQREIEQRPALSLTDHVRATTGMDVITAGLQSSRVVARGFNSSFSGRLHTLTDDRVASVPSLRVNMLATFPQTSDDVQRVEIALGPAAALYGPDTAHGVLHVVTRSPIDDPGSTVSLAGGERDVVHAAGRTAIRLSDRFGVKLSGQYFHGRDWGYADPDEIAARQAADADFDAWKQLQPPGLSEAELHRRAGRVAARDASVGRYTLDARADWRPTPDAFLILSAGQARVQHGIELTGVGAAMLDDWTFGYYQARLRYRRWFAQAYVNTSDAGGTFMLLNGAPIVDRSRLWAAQLQHGTHWRGMELTYGSDLSLTQPVTGGTIHGTHEDGDNYTEAGAYLQSRVPLGTRIDLLLAGRWDLHTGLGGSVASPRAALIVRPAQAHTFRVTYNRAFSTPRALDLFHDMDQGPARGRLAALGFRYHAHGAGRNGIRLADSNGWPLGMRVPGRAGLVNVTAADVYDAQLGLLIGLMRTDPVTAALVPLLQQLGQALQPGATQIPVMALDPSRNTLAPVAGSVRDVPGLVRSIATVWEIGYKGLIGERLLLTADAWRSSESDFTSSLMTRTPLFLLDPQPLGEYLAQHAAPVIASALVQAGHADAVAHEQAGQVIAAWTSIPAGVASSPDLEDVGANLLRTYVNLGNVALWGLDLSARWLVAGTWSLSGTYSHVSDHSFCLAPDRSRTASGGCPNRDLLALNAPTDKLTASLAYHSTGSGLVGEVRARHTGRFPVNSSAGAALQCIGGGGEPCVSAYTLLDVLLGTHLPIMPGASAQLAITNVLNERYQSFVRIPDTRRLILLRLRYDF